MPGPHKTELTFSAAVDKSHKGNVRVLLSSSAPEHGCSHTGKTKDETDKEIHHATKPKSRTNTVEHSS